MTKKQIGAELKRMRIIKGLTQKGLADLIPTDGQRITAIENGKSNVSIERLLKICDLLGVTIAVVKQTEDYTTL